MTCSLCEGIEDILYEAGVECIICETYIGDMINLEEEE